MSQYVPRDISWLSFNYRVLQEAKDQSVPLLERLKFLAIYSSNLDEFFRVRVASLRHLDTIQDANTRADLNYDPFEILEAVLQIVNEQQEEFSKILHHTIIPELKSHHIHLKRRLELSSNQQVYIEDFFMDRLLPYVQPVLIEKGKIMPFLNNASIYLSVLLQDKNDETRKKYAVVQVPSKQVGRFIVLPSEKDSHDLIMLDDLVRHNISKIFPGYHIIDTFSIKITRDAELYIEDEYSGDLIQKIKSSLRKREVGEVSRMVYDRTMPNELLTFLSETFEIPSGGFFKEGRYHNNFDFFAFPDFGKKQLKNPECPPIRSKALSKIDCIFEAIREKDRMLFYPYHSYEHVLEFFDQAASDPNVIAIKIVQYRVAKDSKIMDALIKAKQSGKNVTTFVEVKARFDEEANLKWAERLEAEGVKVLYSFPGLKVHCKIAEVQRVEGNQTRTYTYLSTGNFHEGTAKVYTDFGLFTCNPKLSGEVSKLFTFLSDIDQTVEPFGKDLLVGQFNLRKSMTAMLDREIDNAKKGKKAYVFAKMNSLEDSEVVDKLYEASQAGVIIRLIVRGICCLKPGVPGLSENIIVTSIVDKYLEHARVYIFHNEGEEEMYLSSADWMKRNLSRRIETAFRILDKDIFNEIKQYLEIQIKDNQKARIVDEHQCNNYVQRGENDPFVRSQVVTYEMIKTKEEE